LYIYLVSIRINKREILSVPYLKIRPSY